MAKKSLASHFWLTFALVSSKLWTLARKGGKCISSWSNSASASKEGEQAFELSVEEEETEEAVALWRHCSSSPLEAHTSSVLFN